VAEPIRVLVVDDDARFVDAVSALLAGDEQIVVVGTAANGEEGVLRALWLRPDVVTMDLEMPVVDGVQATRDIRAKLPGTRVVVVSSSEFADRAEAARDAGASAYMTKSRAADELAQTIHAVARGANFIAVV
jgi:NarL family two-component system response regulator LiaR